MENTRESQEEELHSTASRRSAMSFKDRQRKSSSFAATKNKPLMHSPTAKSLTSSSFSGELESASYSPASQILTSPHVHTKPTTLEHSPTTSSSPTTTSATDSNKINIVNNNTSNNDDVGGNQYSNNVVDNAIANVYDNNTYEHEKNTNLNARVNLSNCISPHVPAENDKRGKSPRTLAQLQAMEKTVKERREEESELQDRATWCIDITSEKKEMQTSTVKGTNNLQAEENSNNKLANTENEVYTNIKTEKTNCDVHPYSPRIVNRRQERGKMLVKYNFCNYYNNSSANSIHQSNSPLLLCNNNNNTNVSGFNNRISNNVLSHTQKIGLNNEYREQHHELSKSNNNNISNLSDVKPHEYKCTKREAKKNSTKVSCLHTTTPATFASTQTEESEEQSDNSDNKEEPCPYTLRKLVSSDHHGNHKQKGNSSSHSATHSTFSLSPVSSPRSPHSLRETHLSHIGSSDITSPIKSYQWHYSPRSLAHLTKHAPSPTKTFGTPTSNVTTTTTISSSPPLVFCVNNNDDKQKKNDELTVSNVHSPHSTNKLSLLSRHVLSSPTQMERNAMASTLTTEKRTLASPLEVCNLGKAQSEKLCAQSMELQHSSRHHHNNNEEEEQELLDSTYRSKKTTNPSPHKLTSVTCVGTNKPVSFTSHFLPSLGSCEEKSISRGKSVETTNTNSSSNNDNNISVHDSNHSEHCHANDHSVYNSKEEREELSVDTDAPIDIHGKDSHSSNEELYRPSSTTSATPSSSFSFMCKPFKRVSSYSSLEHSIKGHHRLPQEIRQEKQKHKKHHHHQHEHKQEHRHKSAREHGKGNNNSNTITSSERKKNENSASVYSSSEESHAQSMQTNSKDNKNNTAANPDKNAEFINEETHVKTKTMPNTFDSASLTNTQNEHNKSSTSVMECTTANCMDANSNNDDTQSALLVELNANLRSTLTLTAESEATLSKELEEQKHNTQKDKIMSEECNIHTITEQESSNNDVLVAYEDVNANNKLSNYVNREFVFHQDNSLGDSVCEVRGSDISNSSFSSYNVELAPYYDDGNDYFEYSHHNNDTNELVNHEMYHSKYYSPHPWCASCHGIAGMHESPEFVLLTQYELLHFPPCVYELMTNVHSTINTDKNKTATNEGCVSNLCNTSAKHIILPWTGPTIASNYNLTPHEQEVEEKLQRDGVKVDYKAPARLTLCEAIMIDPDEEVEKYLPIHSKRWREKETEKRQRKITTEMTCNVDDTTLNCAKINSVTVKDSKNSNSGNNKNVDGAVTPTCEKGDTEIDKVNTVYVNNENKLVNKDEDNESVDDDNDDNGECECSEEFITRHARGCDYSTYNICTLFKECTYCKRQPAVFLCLNCLQSVCPSHVTKHYEESCTHKHHKCIIKDTFIKGDNKECTRVLEELHRNDVEPETQQIEQVLSSSSSLLQKQQQEEEEEEEEEEQECTLFVNLLDFKNSFDRTFWCEKCQQFTWKYTEVYDPLIDWFVSTWSSYWDSAIRDMHIISYHCQLSNVTDYGAIGDVNNTENKIEECKNSTKDETSRCIVDDSTEICKLNKESELSVLESTENTGNDTINKQSIEKSDNCCIVDDNNDNDGTNKESCKIGVQEVDSTKNNCQLQCTSKECLQENISLSQEEQQQHHLYTLPNDLINSEHETVCHTNEINNAVNVNHENVTKINTIMSDQENVNIDKEAKKMVSHVHCPRCEPRLTALGVSVQGWRSTQEDAEIGFMLPLPLLRIEHCSDNDKKINVAESLQQEHQEQYEHQLCEQSKSNTTDNLNNTHKCHEGKNDGKNDNNNKKVVDYNNDKTVINIDNNYSNNNNKEEVESWCSLPAAVFAVFDGHGGDAIAKLSAAYFETYLMNAINHCVAKIDENKKKKKEKMKKVDTANNNNGVCDIITNKETITGVNSTTDMNDQNAKEVELVNKREQGTDDKASKYDKDNDKNVIEEKRVIKILEENKSNSTEKDEVVSLYKEALHILYKVHYSSKRYSRHAEVIETSSNQLQENNNDDKNMDHSKVHITQTNALTDEKRSISAETIKATTSSSLHELQHESPSEKQLVSNVNCTHSIDADTTTHSQSLETHKSFHLIGTLNKHENDDVDDAQTTEKVICLESTTLPYNCTSSAYSATNTLTTTNDRSLHTESCTCSCHKEQEHENNVIESKMKDNNDINTECNDGINTVEQTKVSLTCTDETTTSVALTDEELNILHQFFTELFTDALLSLDDYLYKTPEGYRGDYNCVGATACIVLITSQLIICANVGDSGAALYSFHTNDISTECNELHNTKLIRKATINNQSNDQNNYKEVHKEEEYKLQQGNECKQELSEKYEEMKKENQCCSSSCCSQPEKSAPEKIEKTCMCGCTIERLTTPHRITDTEEQERVKAAGYALFSNKDKYTDNSHGCVNNDENDNENSENEINDLRIEGVLSVPRALGDYDFKQCGNKNAKQQAVIAVPTITIRPVPHALLQSLPCNCHWCTNVDTTTVNDVNVDKNINSNITQETFIKQTNVAGEAATRKATSNSKSYESMEEKHNNNISHSHVNVEQSSLCTAKCKWGIVLGCDGIWDTLTLHQLHYALMNTHYDYEVYNSACAVICQANEQVWQKEHQEQLQYYKTNNINTEEENCVINKSTTHIDPRQLTSAAGVLAQSVAAEDNDANVGLDNCSLILIEWNSA